MNYLDRFKNRPWRFVRFILLALLALAALPVLAAATWNAVLDARDSRRFKPAGQLVKVDGLRLHLHCTGQGEPTVILASGWAMPGSGWAQVQPELAKQMRVCSYDRLGSGYSDANPSLGPRTQEQIAEQLHGLLARALVPGPFVLVGHSNGGLEARCYFERYPQEVAGIVLVDSSSEYMNERFQRLKEENAYKPRPEADDPALDRLKMRFKFWAGFVRWEYMKKTGNPALQLSRDYVGEAVFLMNQPKWYPAAISEADGTQETDANLKSSRGLGSLPLIVLTAGKFWPNGDYSDEIALKMRRAWVEEIQPPLARLSTRGRHVIVDSGHMIPFEAPGAVVQAVADIIAMIPPKATR